MVEEAFTIQVIIARTDEKHAKIVNAENHEENLVSM